MNSDNDKIFIGFATKQKKLGRKIATWIESEGMEHYSWDKNIFSKDSDELFQKLIKVARNDVRGAIFIFGEDDDLKQPSVNVLIEYGLYVGVLGKNRVKICIIGQPEIPSDLGKVLYVDLNKDADAEEKIIEWLHELPPKNTTLSLKGKKRLILKHLAERKSTHGYTTDSYLNEYCEEEGLSVVKKEHFLSQLIDFSYINQEFIHKEKVFFITEDGIIEANRRQNVPVTELEVTKSEVTLSEN